MSSESVIACGVGEALVPLIAPLSGCACVLYQVELGRLQRLWLDGFRRRPFRQTVSSPFVLWSGAQPLLVEPSHAALWLRVSERGPMHADALCERLGRVPSTASLWCHERRLDVGQEIWVRGVVTREPDPSGRARGYRLPPTTTRIVASAIGVA